MAMLKIFSLALLLLLSSEATFGHEVKPTLNLNKLAIDSCPEIDKDNCHLKLASRASDNIVDFEQKCEILALTSKRYVEMGQLSLAEPLINIIKKNVKSDTAEKKPPPNERKICHHGALNGLILAYAKAGQLDTAKELMSYVYRYNQGQELTAITIEILKQYLKKNNNDEAIKFSTEYLSQYPALSRQTGIIDTVSLEFYALISGLDYEQFVRQQIPTEFNIDEKENRKFFDKLTRLLYIIAFDVNNYQYFESYLPSGLSPETKANLFTSMGFQLLINDKKPQADFFLKKGIEQAKLIADEMKRIQSSGNMFFMMMSGLGDSEISKELASLFSKDINPQIAQAVLTQGYGYAEKEEFDKAEERLAKADKLLSEVINKTPEYPSRVIASDPNGSGVWGHNQLSYKHAKLTKAIVQNYFSKGDMAAGLKRFQKSQEINNTVTQSDYSKLMLHKYLEEGNMQEAFKVAESIVEPPEFRFSAYAAVADKAETLKNRSYILKAGDKAIEALNTASSGIRNGLLINTMHLVWGKRRNYTLAKRMVEMNPVERRDDGYLTIAFYQAEKGDLEDAGETIKLMLDPEKIQRAENEILIALAKSGSPEAAINAITPETDDRVKFEAFGGILKKDPQMALKIVPLINDLYYFAKANLLLSDLD